MYKSISFYAAFGNRTGYQIHAEGLCNALEKLIPVYRNQPGGDVSISLLDTVTASQTKQFPPKPSILYNVWEADLQPAGFIENLKNYSQLWVASEAQRAWSIAQGIKEEFVFTVPEGIDPDIFKPLENQPKSDTFNFLVCGQWQRRKSTLEIVQSFLRAFPDNPNVRLYLSVDTLFPSDPWKSTEERLEKNGISDARIIPVHFEERTEYVRRLQTCQVYLQCSRSEGFGRPGLEAMACGAVAILENYGGSTEFSDGALLVNVPKLEKPEGIYGNWEVPGMWGSPDYDHLVEVMRDAYDNYTTHKAKALITSTKIRTKFSWDAAAKKAYDIIQEGVPPNIYKPVIDQQSGTSCCPGESAIANNCEKCPVELRVECRPDWPGKRNEKAECPVLSEVKIEDPEQDIQAYARKHGYEITAMRKQRVIFTVDCHPTSQDKMDTLSETVKQIHDFGYPVLISSHVPLPAPIVELADFYIYDKRDVLSPPTDMPVYWRRKQDGTMETTTASIPCHAVASTMNVRNAIDFCLGKYDWIYHMCYDTEVDLKAWLEKVQASDKILIGTRWDHQENTFSGQLFAGRIDVMDKIVQHVTTWEEFVKVNGARRFNSEEVFLERIARDVGMENVEILDMELGNRFDQVDRDAWKDDDFQCHFVDGPFLNIVGISNREYDVIFNDGTRDVYGLKQKVGVWSKPSMKYFKPWTVTAKLDGEVKFTHTLALKGKRVLISMGSKALGDTIAWMPYVEEFRKKHGCHIICSSWWKHIFDYPEIEFVNPGTGVADIYATYDVGCFDDQLDKNVTNWRLTNLQKVSADILGIDYAPIRAKLKYEPYKKGGNGHEPKPYVCFSEFSTMRNKLWNREGAWQKIIDHLVGLGYDCVSISVEKTQLRNVISHNGQPIEQSMTDVSGCEFYIGLNAGPTWLAYALDKPYVLITGVSEEWNDAPNPYRVAINHDVCGIGCFNDPSLPISRDWLWCPRNKDYACTREITEEMVIEQINKIRKEKGYAAEKGKVKCRGVRKHKRNDDVRPPAISGCGRSSIKRRTIQTEVQT
jgi:autotransporter strand-loop-strand O-heptosyltransferase